MACNGVGPKLHATVNEEDSDSRISQDRLFQGCFRNAVNGCTYETLLDCAKHIQSRITTTPKIGIICGSGLGSLADYLEDKVSIKYADIPSFPQSTVQGHAGQLVFGTISGTFVVCMQGRFHHYEGYPLWKCALPIRVMKLIGVKYLIATNAAGGINSAYTEGDVMIIRDHINMMGFAGNNPLQGPNDDRWGPRFPPMNKAYDADLRSQAKKIWREENFDGRLFEGVYTCLGGPNFETVAELRMLKLVGVDAVGMSTVHEVLLARHCDMIVLAFSLITNVCAMDYHDHGEPSHGEVMDVGKHRASTLSKFVAKIVEYIAKNRLDKDFSYEDIEAAANIVLGKISKPPVIAVVCGKNIDTFPDTFEDKVDIPYEEINFPPATIPKCSVLTCGTLGGVSIVAFRGRFYLHKGASIDRLVLPARLSKLLGVKVMVLVSSASAINEGYNPGDLMFLKDHINFVGFGSDKVATADERWGGGSRTLKYNELRKCAMDSAANSGFPGQVHEGVYVCASMGKHQTVMETKMFKQLGGDVVGTSIAYETLAAVECNIEVVGLAIVTATVPLDYDGEMKKWDWLDDTIPPLMGEIVKGVTNCMKEQGMLEEETPPEAQEDEKPPEEAPEEEKAHDEPEEEKPTEEAEAVVGEGAEEGEPPEDAEKEKPLETAAEDETIPGDEGKPAAEEEKKPKKPCECKKKPSEAAPPPPEQPPEQPPEEKKKKRSCECKDKKKAESGAAAPGGPAASASKVPSATTPAGGASAAKVPSAATPVGGASAAKVPSAATPTGGASAAKVPSAATPTGGASAAKVPSAATPGAGTPVGGASAAKVPSGVNPEQEEEAEQ